MFQLGSKVKWVSYPSGIVKEYAGTIIDVLEAGEQPPKSAYPSIWKRSTPGQGRNHESYVVLSDNGEEYWPIVSRMELISNPKASKQKVKARTVNLVGYSLDHSGSMQSKANAAKNDFNSNITLIKTESNKHNQESYVTVSQCGVHISGSLYHHSSYGNRLSMLNFDINDVPLLTSYEAAGNTPLYDSIMELIESLEYSGRGITYTNDISYLVYVITDGKENASKTYDWKLKNKIIELQDTGKWTFTFRVPKGYEKNVANLGVPSDNILTWDGSTSSSLDYSGALNNAATTSYFTGRAAGQTASRSFYANIRATDSVIKKKLDDITANVWLWPVTKEMQIRDFVEEHITTSYTKGKAFYQLTKSEDVQDYKELIIQDKRDGKIYGGTDAKSLLGLPVMQVGTIKLKPGNCGNYDVFVESTSVNRKLLPNTRVLYLK